jgi:hypothetical protein
MTPRPLYRLKSFWFGVLVIAFLGWAWNWSRYRSDQLTWRLNPASAVTLSQASGGVWLWWGDNWGPGDRIEYLNGDISKDSQLLNVAIFRKSRPGFWNYGVSHWFIILLFLVPWSGWLAWRWRRIRKFAAARG